MYITKTTNNVRELLEKLEREGEKTKLKFLLYMLNGIYNGQINSKNIENPNLEDEEENDIFSFESIGESNNFCLACLDYLVKLYNLTNENTVCFNNNGHITGVTYDEQEKELISTYERLSFVEKLDIISEIIIRYDNNTYFNSSNKITLFNDSFDIARKIQIYKENYL